MNKKEHVRSWNESEKLNTTNTQADHVRANLRKRSRKVLKLSSESESRPSVVFDTRNIWAHSSGWTEHESKVDSSCLRSRPPTPSDRMSLRCKKLSDMNSSNLHSGKRVHDDHVLQNSKKVYKSSLRVVKLSTFEPQLFSKIFYCKISFNLI